MNTPVANKKIPRGRTKLSKFFSQPTLFLQILKNCFGNSHHKGLDKARLANKFNCCRFEAATDEPNMSLTGKKVQDTLIVMTELVLPNDTNVFGNLMGGRLMYWMDIAAALSAMKHCSSPVVTASVDNISFENPIRLGNVVHIEAKISRAFTTSMEIHLKVWGEDPVQQFRYKSNEAFYTFVSLDPNGKPKKVPASLPETGEEKEFFDGALRRRQIRLILSGKMKPEEAGELKALFFHQTSPA
ncbi:MAG: acyl-CoA thioesterase [Chitinophagaceae bacterium]